MKTTKLILTSFIVLSATFSYLERATAVDIQFPEEELARESVYPVFDNPVPVKRRNVVLSNHFEVGAYGGWSMNDALFEPLMGGAMLTYHFNELHAAQVTGGIFSTKSSQYVPQIEEDGRLRNLSTAPAPKNFWLLNYQITPYYGKISLTKQGVMNLSIFATLGAGQITIGDTSYLGFGLGIGQKLYITKNLGIRADLRALIHDAPNPIKNNLPSSTQPNSYYDKQSVTDTHLTLGVIYIL